MSVLKHTKSEATHGTRVFRQRDAMNDIQATCKSMRHTVFACEHARGYETRGSSRRSRIERGPCILSCGRARRGAGAEISEHAGVRVCTKVAGEAIRCVRAACPRPSSLVHYAAASCLPNPALCCGLRWERRRRQVRTLTVSCGMKLIRMS